ncbi:UDP-N-acetylmuramate--L-alanine ligase [Candidatus Shapirobacteria bacterium CG09_land_8_20_14_0_10_49_15]|uniref:UDP-N-acetylmuramate--L-alanine ligase n=2 Tax=Candidatus Shapironibacteriota TaxID=1752721 RepID=A0A2M8L6E8_9BACT|nr:MAG: UDP-N-acetylmuramate--L-alanine ligase [Candidatus Shapirobacteria bacterium CG09_land_8_20_14_0_10_49_15]PJE69823.1 MAG: UDP-N-acetylmuramate--L-alanine ligase [Candidatus Shapirobacteria bacterium CG10_big_fil_rev_8_21_14_0_10_48_15]
MTKKQAKLHVHFMGIGGSALAGVAVLAQKAGFSVSGCDLEAQTYYMAGLEKAGIKPLVGHDVQHLQAVDILAVSPAVLALNPNHPEVVAGKKAAILITWQEFMGKYLQKGKYVLAVAGAHGKSTTTALLGLVLEAAKLDPTVEVGAIVPSWQATARPGRSNYFVCEADEFNYNFLAYRPSLLIINNIEMDHPEFFKGFSQLQGAFEQLIHQLKPPKILIVNEESEGVKKVLEGQKIWLERNRVKLIGYFLEERFAFPFASEYQGIIKKADTTGTKFEVNGPSGHQQFKLTIPGFHNVVNSLGVLAAADQLRVNPATSFGVLAKFGGVRRRFELIGASRGVRVFDDYAVHPTAVSATLKSAKQKYPQARLWAIFEPHQYSRLDLFLISFADALDLADKVVVTKTYAGREKTPGKTKPVDLVRKIGLKAAYQPDFNKLASDVARQVRRNDLVIVFGAGKSYQISKLILEKLSS